MLVLGERERAVYVMVVMYQSAPAVLLKLLCTQRDFIHIHFGPMYSGGKTLTNGSFFVVFFLWLVVTG